MDLLKLKYFYTVAQYEHVTKAAESLHIAQPAITKCIKQLESELDVTLFMRSGRNVKLTEYGKLLKNRLDNVFPIIDGVKDEINQLKKENKFTVKLNVLAASIAVMEAVVKYKNKYPEVVFNIIQHTNESICDIMVTTTGSESERHEHVKQNLKKRCVIEENIFLAVPTKSDYAKNDSVQLKSLKNEKFIYIAGSRPFRSVCDKICENIGFKPSIGFESDSPIAVKNIIGADAGVGFWPEYSWGKINSKDVKLLPVTDAECKRELIVELYDQAGMSEYAENFYEFLISKLSKGQNK